jgi:hypothetical protein
MRAAILLPYYLARSLVFMLSWIILADTLELLIPPEVRQKSHNLGFPLISIYTVAIS